ncbi:hypothetical protein Tco_0223801, partial [Tanacetum coccineum]
MNSQYSLDHEFADLLKTTNLQFPLDSEFVALRYTRIGSFICITKEQQQALDDALVPHEQCLKIGSCNYKLSTTFKPKEPTFQVSLDVLSNTPFHQAFLITASVPAIY